MEREAAAMRVGVEVCSRRVAVVRREDLLMEREAGDLMGMSFI